MPQTQTLTAAATLQTEKARRYVSQMCKHFAHKCPVGLEDTWGTIRFPMGDCRLEADDITLRLLVEAKDADSLAPLQDVVKRHLVRFAFREDLTVDWTAG